MHGVPHEQPRKGHKLPREQLDDLLGGDAPQNGAHTVDLCSPKAAHFCNKVILDAGAGQAHLAEDLPQQLLEQGHVLLLLPAPQAAGVHCMQFGHDITQEMTHVFATQDGQAHLAQRLLQQGHVLPLLATLHVKDHCKLDMTVLKGGDTSPGLLDSLKTGPSWPAPALAAA